jgi:PAS domain S-box-containing protein
VKRPARSRRPARALPGANLQAAALQALGEGVFIAELRPRGRLSLVCANPRFCAMTGCTPAELAGRTLEQLHGEKPDCERLHRWLRAKRPAGILTGEGYLVRKDGTTLYAAWSFSRMPAAGGRRHIVASYRDMTEKRKLQEALMHAQRLDAVGRLAGGVAHDFNNLLSVINGYCEMLAALVAEMPRALHEVNEIHKAGRKAAALTRQLLAFGRRQPMNARVTDLNQVIRDNADILGRLLGGTGQLVLELAPDLGNVRTDPAQFQQVLVNLTINARDALRASGRVVIGTANREIKLAQNRRLTDTPPGRYVGVTVSDNGTGMDEEVRKHLFEPFFTTKPEGQGTGLGLAMVHGVVQQSGGFITVRSEPGAGTTFEILLPAVREPVDRRNAASPFVPVPPPVRRRHETILLVEEDAVLGKMIAGMLAAEGYRVIEARQPAEAAAGLRGQTRQVELLIANVAGDGEKLARSIYMHQPALRLLNLCNQNDPPTLAWLAPEHQASLPKPFALSELLRTARKLLDA